MSGPGEAFALCQNHRWYPTTPKSVTHIYLIVYEPIRREYVKYDLLSRICGELKIPKSVTALWDRDSQPHLIDQEVEVW